jgi:hypothetical protein
MKHAGIVTMLSFHESTIIDRYLFSQKFLPLLEIAPWYNLIISFLHELLLIFSLDWDWRRALTKLISYGRVWLLKLFMTYTT